MLHLFRYVLRALCVKISGGCLRKGTQGIQLLACSCREQAMPASPHKTRQAGGMSQPWSKGPARLGYSCKSSQVSPTLHLIRSEHTFTFLTHELAGQDSAFPWFMSSRGTAICTSGPDRLADNLQKAGMAGRLSISSSTLRPLQISCRFMLMAIMTQALQQCSAQEVGFVSACH